MGSCIQLVRIERRRSIYSGAEMMPSARNGVSAEVEADDAGVFDGDAVPLVYGDGDDGAVAELVGLAVLLPKPVLVTCPGGAAAGGEVERPSFHN